MKEEEKNHYQVSSATESNISKIKSVNNENSVNNTKNKPVSIQITNSISPLSHNLVQKEINVHKSD